MKKIILVTLLALLAATTSAASEGKEARCLAQAVYHEARGESLRGQRAVAHATLNRVRAEKWPDTICGVVNQPGQYSWHGKAKRISDQDAYQQALKVATAAINGRSADPTRGATYFFSGRAPGWARRFETTAVIGSHTFKRE